MTIEQSKLIDTIERAIAEATKTTDTILTREIAEKTRLTKKEIDTFCPNFEDVEKLTELIDILQNQENKNKFRQRIEVYSDVIFNLLSTLLCKK